MGGLLSRIFFLKMKSDGGSARDHDAEGLLEVMIAQEVADLLAYFVD